MKLTKANTIYQLTFLPTLFPINCFFVEEDDALTLIDTAMSFSAEKILTTAKKIGKPITKIVLTHPHLDHIGGLDKIKERLPNVPVYISERDAALMSGDFSYKDGEPREQIKGSFPKQLRTKPDVLLNDGDMVGSLLTIMVPGHTPGSLAFIDTRNKFIIAGDAFQLRGGIAVSGDKRPLFPFPAMGTWSFEAAINSAEKIAELKPALLAVGHGAFLREPMPAINMAIERAKQKLNK